MKISPARSLVLAALSFAAATIAAVGALYQPEPSVRLQSPDSAFTELAPAPTEATATPGQ